MKAYIREKCKVLSQFGIEITPELLARLSNARGEIHIDQIARDLLTPSRGNSSEKTVWCGNQA